MDEVANLPERKRCGLPKKAFSSETSNTVRMLVPMDDVMFQKMCEEKAACQEIISTILEEDVVVEEVIPQDFIMNLQGRSVRFGLPVLIEERHVCKRGGSEI